MRHSLDQGNDEAPTRQPYCAFYTTTNWLNRAERVLTQKGPYFALRVLKRAAHAERDHSGASTKRSAWNAITSPLHTWHRHHLKHLDRSTGRMVMRVILQQIGHGVLRFPLDDRKPRDLTVALANGWTGDFSRMTERRAQIDDRVVSLLRPRLPQVHARFHLLGCGRRHLLRCRHA